MRESGRLTIVGSGIEAGRDLSQVAIHRIRTADKVLFLVSEPITAIRLRELNKSAESLQVFYSPRKNRLTSYHQMVDRIMSFVKRKRDVCVVTYGHPGVFAYPTHTAIKRARKLGVQTAMLPAVSAIDCLIADLGVDPATDGLAVFDASDFLFRRRVIDPNMALVILQIGITANARFNKNGKYNRAGLRALAAKLSKVYGKDHESIIYEASTTPVEDPSIIRVALGKIASADVTASSTLYIPPKGAAPLEKEMLRRFAAE